MTPLDELRQRCPADETIYACCEGIWRFLSADRQEYYERFMREYQIVRQAEQRGSADSVYYRSLPFADLSGRFTTDWRIRATVSSPFSVKWLEAGAIRLVEIQDHRDLDAAWRDLGAALLDPNPFLAETALDQHLKFRRGDVALLPPARELLLSPKPSVRARAATLASLVLSRGGIPEDAEAATIADLTATARRDPDPSVRAAATRALGASPRADALEALKAIARVDPDQGVRYAAERELFERSTRGGRVD